MPSKRRNWIYFLIGCIGTILFFSTITPAKADEKNHFKHVDLTINNYYENPEPVVNTTNLTELTITNSLSSSDLAAGVATAMAAGGHQFDFSTTDWQGSITGVWQLSDENENNASFAIGKRWKEGFMPNALVHFTYTPNGSEDWIMVGGTFRF